MAGTRKARVPMTEQIRLINECRQSGMTDADWCRENDIAVSTFYNWVSRCRKTAADQIPAANYGHLEVPRPKQDVVPIDVNNFMSCHRFTPVRCRKPARFPVTSLIVFTIICPSLFVSFPDSFFHPPAGNCLTILLPPFPIPSWSCATDILNL